MSTSPWNHRIQIASNHGGDQAIMNAVAAITVGYDARGGWLGTGNPPSHYLIHDFHSNDDGKIYAAAIMHSLIVLGLFESLTLDGNISTQLPPQPPPTKTLAIQAVVTGGFPVPDVTFHFIQDGVEVLASEVSIPNTQIVVGQQIKQSWNVPTGHTVQIVMRLANPLGAVDVPSTTVNT